MNRYSHHKYVWSKPFSSVRHNWELVGPYGAIHFHVSMTPNYDPSCGLEYHHTEAGVARVGGHFRGTAPHHINCPLTGGRCWHDGTSLYASETVWPFVESYLRVGDHEAIFRFLEGEADRHFGHREEVDEDADTTEPQVSPGTDQMTRPDMRLSILALKFLGSVAFVAALCTILWSIG